MPRPRRKYKFWTAFKFLFTREIQTLQPRASRAADEVEFRQAQKAEGERQKIDEVEKQYNNLEPIK